MQAYYLEWYQSNSSDSSVNMLKINTNKIENISYLKKVLTFLMIEVSKLTRFSHSISDYAKLDSRV